MKLLENFNIHSFSRTVWLTKKAREVWEKPLRDITQLVQELEVLSVVEGHRLCSWQTIPSEQVLEQAKKWANLGLVALPVKEVASFQGFAHRHETPAPGGPKSVCFVVSRDIKNCVQYQEAFDAGDNITQGRLLGFPECCCKFFEESWKSGCFDPMWQAAQRSLVIENGERFVKIAAHPHSNALLRYAGVRVGFHIPCSFNCQETVRVASTRMELARKRDESLSVLLEALLQMPMRWDVLHGLAVIKTPIFYLVVQSVPTTERYVVEVDGSFVPQEAENGPVCSP